MDITRITYAGIPPGWYERTVLRFPATCSVWTRAARDAGRFGPCSRPVWSHARPRGRSFSNGLRMSRRAHVSLSLIYHEQSEELALGYRDLSDGD